MFQLRRFTAHFVLPLAIVLLAACSRGAAPEGADEEGSAEASAEVAEEVAEPAAEPEEATERAEGADAGAGEASGEGEGSAMLNTGALQFQRPGLRLDRTSGSAQQDLRLVRPATTRQVRPAQPTIRPANRPTLRIDNQLRSGGSGE